MNTRRARNSVKSRAIPLPDPRRRNLGVYSAAELLDKRQLPELKKPDIWFCGVDIP